MLEVVFSDSAAGAMLVAIGHQHSIGGATAVIFAGEGGEQDAAIPQAEMEKLQSAMDMLTYKCWFYEEALKTGCRPDTSICTMPDDIRTAYSNSLGKICC